MNYTPTESELLEMGFAGSDCDFCLKLERVDIHFAERKLGGWWWGIVLYDGNNNYKWDEEICVTSKEDVLALIRIFS